MIMPRPDQTVRKPDVVLIVVFLAIMAAGSLGTVFGARYVAVYENRALARAPTLASLKEPLELPRLVSSYVADHFGFRNLLLSGYFQLRLRVLSADAAQDIVKGKDGWIFITSEVRDFRNQQTLTPADILNIRNRIDAWCEYVRARGAELVLLVAPNKSTIYPEKMPDYLTKFGNASNLDRLYAEDFSCPVIKIDVRPRLLAMKDEEELYYRWGTHWNERVTLDVWEQIKGASQRAGVKRAWMPSRAELSSRPAYALEDSLWGWYANRDPAVLPTPQVSFMSAAPAEDDREAADAHPVRLLGVGDSFMKMLSVLAGGFVGDFVVTPATSALPSSQELSDKKAWFALHPPAQSRIDVLFNRFHADVVVLERAERNLRDLIALPLPPGYFELWPDDGMDFVAGVGTDHSRQWAIIARPTAGGAIEVGDEIAFEFSGIRKVVRIADMNERHDVVFVDGPLDRRDGFPHPVKRLRP